NQQTAQQLLEIIATAETMTQRYDVVVTNPPYLNKMNSTLKKYVKKHYKDYSADLFSVFIWHNINMTKVNGYAGYMTPFVWMFIKSYEKLRTALLSNVKIDSLIQLEYSAFEEATVPINTFVLKNTKNDETGTYLRLSAFKGGMMIQAEKVQEAIADPGVKYLYRTNQTNFTFIPGTPIAYWAPGAVLRAFHKNTPIYNIARFRIGLVTGDSMRFVRYWSEVKFTAIGLNISNDYEARVSRKKWFPYQKGGDFRKWFGNNLFVVNWKNDGYEMKHDNYSGSRLKSHNFNGDFAFQQGITWTKISSGAASFRFVPSGYMFDDASPFGKITDKKRDFLMAFLNSKVTNYILGLLNPTLNYLPGTIEQLPLLRAENEDQITKYARSSLAVSSDEWIQYESTWQFRNFPILSHIAEHNRNWTVEAAFNQWKQEAQDRFDQLKKNEEELNKIFIDLYGLQDELSPEESDKEVSVRKADLGRDIRAFMSYFIGVTFGRYSLDTPGLAFAGGDWDASKYTSYQPNADDVIVLTDSDYFGDDRDIMHRFREFLTVTFGEEHLEENLTFIAKALGKAGDTAEDQIRSYLFNDFYKNHLTIYQKRPIYWQLDSGRQGGFKALMYLHRYDGDTMAMIRTSYLHTLQAAYEKRVTTLNTFIASETNTRQKNQLIKQRDHTRKQLEELVKYDAQLQHVANMHIAIDLDDGVVVNHQKVQADVKLLTPIK
ncbi:BREX-1 system adenine-specific DNA-methyltransferase PglX, partial [Limosilactobacillus fermentum]|uniref:BREX-1 system adenine-specific DNA-methyltransferase PglX n=3 Tax=Limosilactobacillus fermentum TaxID=1613 RepID=UPI0021A61CD4